MGDGPNLVELDTILKSIIVFEDISKVSFETDDYWLGNGGLRINSRYLKTGIKSTVALCLFW